MSQPYQNYRTRPDSNDRQVTQILLSRRDTALLLGRIDVSTVRRLEREGKLTAIRLRKNGRVYYALDEAILLTIANKKKTED
jgi:hypothetical protein